MSIYGELKCVVIDDEPLAADLIASYIDKTPNMKLLGTFSSAQDAIKPIMSGNVDVVFLDIQMSQLNGIEFSKILPKNCRVIFTTAYDSYAIEAFRNNALDYLLKPISYEEFILSTNKAFEWQRLVRRADESSRMNENIIVKSEYKMIQIPINKILYIEGLKDYLRIFTEDNERGVVSLLSMKSLEKILPSGQFVRIHRSYLVNMSKVRVFERNKLTIGEVLIPIGESHRQAYSDYINSRLVTDYKVSDDMQD